MKSGWLIVSAVLGATGVGLGAFGAHGLKQHLSAEMLAIYEVGVRYQMYHALAMLAVSIALLIQADARWLSRACAAWMVGIVIFSGSLYALALSGITWLGAITPIGGVAMIAGWCFVIVAGMQKTVR